MESVTAKQRPTSPEFPTLDSPETSETLLAWMYTRPWVFALEQERIAERSCPEDFVVAAFIEHGR